MGRWSKLSPSGQLCMVPSPRNVDQMTNRCSKFGDRRGWTSHSPVLMRSNASGREGSGAFDDLEAAWCKRTFSGVNYKNQNSNCLLCCAVYDNAKQSGILQGIGT
ncbi:hypothetical protein GJAV_G00137170 [Gymnothorax javanicus]|nr:hypothetical protein GJAV_G00137170 [Gymnothorax javanicus]